jgi:hypothetical protein
LRIDVHRDEAGALKHFQMSGNGWLAHLERLGEFRHPTIVSAIILVLSLVSIYAVMSFAVSRRTREIGVRVALGGSPWRIVTAVLLTCGRQNSFSRWARTRS